jgi:hypothetical protein
MTFFSFFKPSSNATAFPPHRLRRKPLTETPRHGENFSTGTPTSSSASAPQSYEQDVLFFHKGCGEVEGDGSQS